MSETTFNHVGEVSVLIVEQQHVMTGVFQDKGYACERHAPSAVNTVYTSHVIAKLRRNCYSAVWLDYPRKSILARGRGILSQLLLWLVVCARAQVPAYLFGPSGSHWNERQLRQMCADPLFYETRHRACHFGLKLDAMQPEPSAASFTCLSTVAVVPHLCLCKVGLQEHKLDWVRQDPHRQTNATAAGTLGAAKD